MITVSLNKLAVVLLRLMSTRAGWHPVLVDISPRSTKASEGGKGFFTGSFSQMGYSL